MGGLSRESTITVCAKRLDAEIHMLLAAPTSAAAEMDALRVHLLDTLGARFGYDHVRECMWRDDWPSRLAGCETVARSRILAAVRDSILADTTMRRPAEICPCVLAIPFLTPALIAAFVRDTVASTAPRMRMLTVRTAGGLDQPKDTLLASTYSLEIEYLTPRLIAEARQQEVDVPGAVRLRSVRVGPAFGDRTHMGAVTLGYRWIGGDAATPGRIAGPEIGLPFIYLGRRAEWHADASYVISVHGTIWNYRLEQEFTTGRHFLLGWRLETTSVPIRDRNDIAWTALSAIVGLRR